MPRVEREVLVACVGIPSTGWLPPRYGGERATPTRPRAPAPSRTPRIRWPSDATGGPTRVHRDLVTPPGRIYRRRAPAAETAGGRGSCAGWRAGPAAVAT